MIDFETIKKRPTAGRIFSELFINALQLFLIFYGLKCILTLHGQMPLSIKGDVYNAIHWTPVNGIAAVMAGLCYLGGGLFLYLSDGSVPDENRSWFWRIGRALLRWGSLAIALIVFVKSQKVAGGPEFDFTGSPHFLLIKAVAFIFVFLILLGFLSAMFCREQVKRELRINGCKPVHIWWRPGAYWVCRYAFSHWGTTGFRVIFSDSKGLTHKAYCFVYRSFLKNSQWGSRSVYWIRDQVTGELPLPEVWADNDIVCEKLNEQNSQADNLLDE